MILANKKPTTTAETERFFSTDHLLGNLKQHTVSSGMVQGAAQVVQFILTLGFNVIQARLLTPEDFGLVAMVMTVIGFLQIFTDMQLSTATIQRAEINHAQVSNLFWLNVAVSGVISLLIMAGAPLLAAFYHEPRLVRIALALSGYFILNGLVGQHLALLRRQMRFVAISIIEVVSVAIGLSIGVLLTLAGYGYWSLVVATLAQAVLRLVAVWSISRWRPQLPVRTAGTLQMVKFGANLTLSGFLHSASLGCDSLLIGRVYGSHAVGLYTRAAALLSRPMEQLISPIYAVAVPALSRIQERAEWYRRFYLQVFEAIAIGGFLFAGLALPRPFPYDYDPRRSLGRRGCHLWGSFGRGDLRPAVGGRLVALYQPRTREGYAEVDDL